MQKQLLIVARPQAYRGPLVNLFWTIMGRITGMTRFTKLGLTITNSIGKFSGDGLGNDK